MEIQGHEKDFSAICVTGLEPVHVDLMIVLGGTKEQTIMLPPIVYLTIYLLNGIIVMFVL